ncbi:MAG: Hpt domain-containing protein [Bdellovibrio sp.]
MSKTIVEVDADLQDLIPQFLENRKKDIDSFTLLISNKDFTAIAQLAHKVKGAAAGYGFNDLSSLAAQAETAAKNNDLNSLSDLFEKMKVHFSNIEIRYVSTL